ncbi:hypothetical protein J7T55_001514 [Diaporthe amygdali]|uniref:uncharacterized protein n=1 Tax=Phomopsis amygdali TaxID=1214568 RepID=UPI0022FF220A|nr:uncharacterized protein J7T55_001514 [Diaporthe amygdali]KAJ0115105.1 hypothetical protein J7T55_001514 [Diaporthe amygdali]
MADQPDDNKDNIDPPLRRSQVSWDGCVVIPGPLSQRQDDDDDDASEQPTEDSEETVDSPASPAVGQLERTSSTISDAVDQGKIRDSLELKKYQPPNPLGVRRFSEQGATDDKNSKKPELLEPELLQLGLPAQPRPAQPEPAQPEPAQPEPAQPEPAQPEPELPDPELPKPVEINMFSLPSTMLRLSNTLPRRAPYALNLIKPYPNPTGWKNPRGFKRSYTAPATTGSSLGRGKSADNNNNNNNNNNPVSGSPASANQGGRSQQHLSGTFNVMSKARGAVGRFWKSGA